MCIVSMVMDRYKDDWGRKNDYVPYVPDISEVNRLLEEIKKAKKHDDKHGLKDCEKPDLIEQMQKMIDRNEKILISLEKFLKNPGKIKIVEITPSRSSQPGDSGDHE